jgi:hypothetical protein
MTVLAFPSATTRHCNECGQWKHRARVEDGWCDVCRGENPERVVTVRPAELEPVDWMVVACSVPGIPPGPYSFSEGLRIAREFGGLVRPWAAGTPKALGNYPHYGGRPSGRPAKYGAALQNSKEEE